MSPRKVEDLKWFSWTHDGPRMVTTPWTGNDRWMLDWLADKFADIAEKQLQMAHANDVYYEEFIKPLLFGENRLEIEAAEKGDLGPIKKKHPDLALAGMLCLPPPPGKPKPVTPSKDRAYRAERAWADVTLIRQLWKQHFKRLWRREAKSAALPRRQNQEQPKSAEWYAARLWWAKENRDRNHLPDEVLAGEDIKDLTEADVILAMRRLEKRRASQTPQAKMKRREKRRADKKPRKPTSKKPPARQ